MAGSVGGAGDALLGRPGRPYVRLDGLGGDGVDFDGLPDGSVLAASGAVDVVSADGRRRRPLYGARPEVGPGDGGSAARAHLEGVGVSAGPSGAVLVSQPHTVRHDVPVRLDAYRGPEIFARYPDAGAAGSLRWIGGAPAGRLMAAITPAAYRDLATGQVPVLTTLAGEAHVVARSGRRTVAEASVAVPAGRSDVRLGRRLPPGDYALELTVTSGSQSTRHRLGITTRRILPLREARNAIRQAVRDDISGDGGGGQYYIAEACRRATPLRVACDYIQAYYGDAGSRERCAGKITAHLRPDGLHLLRETSRQARCARDRAKPPRRR